MNARAEPKRGSPRSDGTKPLYAPADSHGHFPPQAHEDARLTDIAETFDLDELELDPSERRPGGPVADAVRSLQSSALAKKWAVPLASFLIASFLQSIALYSATFLYVSWIDELAENLGMQSKTSGVLRNAANSTAAHSRLDAFKLHDNFRDQLGNHDSSPVLMLSYLTLFLPVLWAAVVIRSSNLRLWTRTLLVGTILALLKAVFAWVTVVPDAAGWGDCKAKLDHEFLQEARGKASGMYVLWIFKAFFDVVWLWLGNLFSVNQSSQNLVCSDGVVSGSTYLNSLFALALYDAMRMATRKMKPHFRWIYRLLVAFALTVIVLQAAHVDLMSGRQYAADVTLAIVFAMVLYSNPTIAICVDRWLTSGSSSFALLTGTGGRLKDPYDEGDVVVPLCCLPFCCVHGRYYLYTATVEEVQKQLEEQEVKEKRLAAETRQKASTRAEEFRLTQEEGARRLLELETLMQSEQQRSVAREREEREQAQKQYEKALEELKKESERRLAECLAELEKDLGSVEIPSDLMSQDSSATTCELRAEFDDKLRVLTANVDSKSSAVAEKRLELGRLEEQAEKEKKALEELELAHKEKER